RPMGPLSFLTAGSFTLNKATAAQPRRPCWESHVVDKSPRRLDDSTKANASERLVHSPTKHGDLSRLGRATLASPHCSSLATPSCRTTCPAAVGTTRPSSYCS